MDDFMHMFLVVLGVIVCAAGIVVCFGGIVFLGSSNPKNLIWAIPCGLIVIALLGTLANYIAD